MWFSNSLILNLPQYIGALASTIVSGLTRPRFHRLRRGKYLEGGPQFVDALHRPVEQRAVAGIALEQRLRPVVGVEVGQRDKAQDLARLHIHQDRGGALGVHHLHARLEHFLRRRLHRQVDATARRACPPLPGSRSCASSAFSMPAVPITSAECTPSAPKLAPPSTCAARRPLG